MLNEIGVTLVGAGFRVYAIAFVTGSKNPA
jgi:hypothetical protein